MILVPTISDPMVRSGSTNTMLTGAITRYNHDKLDGEETESVIDGTASMIYKGKRFTGEIVLYNVSAANYAIYQAWERSTVRLWPYGAGSIPNTNPERFRPWVDVFVNEVLPFHKDNDLYQDAVIIRFKSAAYYTVARATSLGYTES